MGAPKNNEYWKLASKHGREAIFKTPEDLQKAIDEYFVEAEKHTITKPEIMKSGAMVGQVVNVEYKTPYTVQKLCLYLNVDRSYLTHFTELNQNKIDEGSPKYSEEEIQKAKEYIRIIARAQETIESQKIDGVSVGLYNPVILPKTTNDVNTESNVASINININSKPVSSDNLIE